MDWIARWSGQSVLFWELVCVIFTSAKTVEKSKKTSSLLHKDLACWQSRDMMLNDHLCAGADDIYIKALMILILTPLTEREEHFFGLLLVLLLVHISKYKNLDLKFLDGNLANSIFVTNCKCHICTVLNVFRSCYLKKWFWILPYLVSVNVQKFHLVEWLMLKIHRGKF